MIDNFFRGIIDLIYPPFCKICNQRLLPKEFAVCESCFSSLIPFNEKNYPETQNLSGIQAAFLFDDKMQSIIHYLKYGGHYKLGFRLGQITGKNFLDFLLNTGKQRALVPVPLHALKKRSRGYNQAEAIAAGIADVSGLAVRTDLLKRIKNTRTQTKLNKQERQQNVAEAFGPRNAKNLPDTVILIDDVFTTGATMDSAAGVLKQMGVSRVHALTVARPRQTHEGFA